MQKTNIYVLRLEGGKYYIGKSNDIMNRYQQHLDGQGAAWTKLHSPVSLEKTVSTVSAFDEDKITLEYMAKYGIDNVRGGSYCQCVLSKFHRQHLNEQIWNAKGLCSNCGRGGHFVKNCYAAFDINGDRIEYEDDEEDDDEDEEDEEDDEDDEDEDEDEEEY